MSNIPKEIQKLMDQPIINIFQERLLKGKNTNLSSNQKRIMEVIQQAQVEAERVIQAHKEKTGTNTEATSEHQERNKPARKRLRLRLQKKSD